MAKTEEDIDDVLAELEAEESVSSDVVQQRMQETGLQRKSDTHHVYTRTTPYTILNSDADTLQFTTEHSKAVVHFQHKDFQKCATMDRHLGRIAEQHDQGEAGGDEVAFGTVDVEKAPFIVERLGIRVLPCVMGFSQGVMKGKVLGFEGICWNNNEDSLEVAKALEQELVTWGLLKRRLMTDAYDSGEEGDSPAGDMQSNGRRGIRGASRRTTSDDEDDWD